MGIVKLLPFLMNSFKEHDISSYSGKTFAIDGQIWLYQAASYCSEELYYDKPTELYCKKILQKINILRKNNIIPIFVFDGDPLPSKSCTNKKRKEQKDKVREDIENCFKDNDINKAKDLMKQCVSISKRMLRNTINMLIEEKVEYIIAPYESDAQMCYLQKIGYVDYILTEDSDLIPYGSDIILYKFKDHTVTEFNRELMKVHHGKFISENILEICVLSGCDYLPSIRGIGLERARKYLQLYGNYTDVIEKLKPKMNVPENYLTEFERALTTFKEQVVYDPIKQIRVYLSGKTIINSNSDLSYLGDVNHNDPVCFAKGNDIINAASEQDLSAICPAFEALAIKS